MPTLGRAATTFYENVRTADKAGMRPWPICCLAKLISGNVRAGKRVVTLRMFRQRKSVIITAYAVGVDITGARTLFESMA